MSTSGRIIKITVSHHSSRHEVSLPAESTFGDVKRLLAHKTGLEPEEQTLIFQGKIKQDEGHLHLEGVKDNSEIFLFKEATSRGRKLEENQKYFDMSKAFEAVGGVRAEVDQLSEIIAALEVAIKCGTDVAENEFLTLSELFMRQLLKLDDIQAKGEAREQRKAEVRRVQSFVDKVDSLREINSTPSSKNGNAIHGQIETETSQTLTNDGFLYSRSQSVPAHASTAEDYSPSFAVTEASANASTNEAKNLAVLCKIDDKATKLLEIAFNKYPNLMKIRSQYSDSFIGMVVSSLCNLLQLLSTASASGTLDAQKKREIGLMVNVLETFQFDASFISEMRLQVSEAWEARLAVDNASSELKTLCSKAEDLNQEIASLESRLEAAKAEVAQVENRRSTLCELVEVEENRSPIFKWIIE